MLQVADNRGVTDVNLELGGLLLDMASLAGDEPARLGLQAGGQGGAAARSADHAARRGEHVQAVPGIGPTTDRIARELIHDGRRRSSSSAIVEAGKEEAVATLRALRQHFLSNAAVREILVTTGARRRAASYRGDFQMHSVWSDGAEPLESIVEACLARGHPLRRA